MKKEKVAAVKHQSVFEHDGNHHKHYSVVCTRNGDDLLVVDLFEMSPSELFKKMSGLGFPESFIQTVEVKYDDDESGIPHVYSYFPVLRPMKMKVLSKEYTPFGVLADLEMGQITGSFQNLVLGNPSIRVYYNAAYVKCHEPGYWNDVDHCIEFLEDYISQPQDYVMAKYKIKSLRDRSHRCLQLLAAKGIDASKYYFNPFTSHVKKKPDKIAGVKRLVKRKKTEEQMRLFLDELDTEGKGFVREKYNIPSDNALVKRVHSYKQKLGIPTNYTRYKA